MLLLSLLYLSVGEVLPMLDDDGSAERQIQSVFDFLDEPDDNSNKGLEYWGAHPRHSAPLTEEHDDDDDVQDISSHKTTADSSDDDVRTSPISPLTLPYFSRQF